MINILMAVLLAAHPTAPRCHAPSGIVQGDLTRSQYRRLYAYGRCVCGPEGWNDYSEVYESRRNRPYELLRDFVPSCERNGWNGRRYLYVNDRWELVWPHDLVSEQAEDRIVDGVCGTLGYVGWNKNGPICGQFDKER